MLLSPDIDTYKRKAISSLYLGINTMTVVRNALLCGDLRDSSQIHNLKIPYIGRPTSIVCMIILPMKVQI